MFRKLVVDIWFWGSTYQIHCIWNILRLTLKLGTHFSLVSVWCTSPIALRSASLGCCPPGNSPSLPIGTITLWRLCLSSSSRFISSRACQSSFYLACASCLEKQTVKVQPTIGPSKQLFVWLLLSFIALALAFPLAFGLAFALGFRANAVSPGRLGRAPTSKTPVSDWSWPCWRRS